VPGNGLFAPTSPWNAALPASVPLDARSPNRIAVLSNTISAAIAHNMPPVVNAGSFSTPFYIEPAGAPRVQVNLDSEFGSGLRKALAAGVPIPAGATAGAGSDGHLSVWQPATNTLWEFWGASKKADGWHARWGGAMVNVSSNLGYYSNSVWPGASTSEGWSWGATATSLPVAAGLVTGAEIRSGVIPHALAAAVPDACGSVFFWPAQRTDGSSSDPNCIPEGAHLRLNPAVNVDALNLSPIAKALAHAAQTYGIIVRDVTHSTFTFFAEAPATAGAGMYTASGAMGQVDHYTALDGFPWSSLQVIAAKQCKIAPC
jgi:hypothetical protein